MFIAERAAEVLLCDAAPEARDATRALAEAAVGRDEWMKEVVYHRRSLAETAMMRFKMIFSDRLRSREWKRRGTELRVRCAAMNKTTGLGMPQSYPI